MKFLIEPQNGLFLGTQDTTQSAESIIDNLRERFYSTEAWFLDLDDNHAKSPAKMIAKRALGTSRFNPSYLNWCLQTAVALATRGKASESESWRDYVEKFLRNPESIEEVRKVITPELAKNSFYPGVLDLCGMLTGRKIYVSRNIEPIIRVYAGVANIDDCIAECSDKSFPVSEYLTRNLHLNNVGIEGDSEEDIKMIEAARSRDRKVISICSMDSPEKPVEGFDFYVSKDRRGLVELLRNH